LRELILCHEVATPGPGGKQANPRGKAWWPLYATLTSGTPPGIFTELKTLAQSAQSVVDCWRPDTLGTAETMIISNRATTLAMARFVAVASAVVFCIGCGRTSAKLSSSEKQAFEAANAHVKQAWERVLAAEKTKDYLNTQNLFDNLGQLQLTEAQKQTLSKEREAFNQRIWQAAEKNDPAAVKAVQASQRSRSKNPGAPSQ